MKSPDSFPWYPYHRLHTERYILPSFFGKRTAVHQASIGCPFPVQLLCDRAGLWQ